VKRELKQIAVIRDCGVVGLLRIYIHNHMYYVAGAAAEDEKWADRVGATWLSLANHIQNIHNHDHPLCAMRNHPHIPDDDQNIEWLVPGEVITIL